MIIKPGTILYDDGYLDYFNREQYFLIYKATFDRSSYPQFYFLEGLSCTRRSIPSLYDKRKIKGVYGKKAISMKYKEIEEIPSWVEDLLTPIDIAKWRISYEK